jgi:hypothetical protein
MILSLSLAVLSLGLLANIVVCKPTSIESTSTAQHLSLSFNSRSQAGRVSVTLQPNNDNKTANGLSLIYSGVVAPSNYYDEFHGFPVLHGAITYPIPANPTAGYASLFGWIQFIKEDVQGEPAANWTVDSFPYASDLKTPFGGWGFNPTLFDAPAILLDEDTNKSAVVWRAQSYLCELVDAGVSKNVTVIPGVAFTWGFDLNYDQKNASQRSIILTKAEELNVKTDWEQRLPLLREQYPDWTFYDA